MVARVALPEPRPLQFKDDVYVRDRISTGERSTVRVLLGGKATVTARERSVLTIAEVFPDENLRSTISVLRGLVDVTRLDKGRRIVPTQVPPAAA